MVEEAIASEWPDRVRRLSPVALAQIEALSRRKVPGPHVAYAVLGIWQQYQTQHPTLINQLRAICAERAAAAQPHDWANNTCCTRPAAKAWPTRGCELSPHRSYILVFPSLLSGA